ncbi:Aldose 1-epimerase [Arcobacter nitrofigilis DSM 7299]|uniref:Aldose 1-epimerase n=1 Tax=Arcobacter nitrofigilis (strain ATCC 33309 / DSM 7299 / CCUG 15893 / LMG 7604 / NCTC 12251 / CI) TaxID=572480 RepID=D5V0E8_ARCNC|nr:aldose 1-epimerase family protein [Arcobacter nitrofigilis]ADG93760.1 Aldose 1-epimerase [Arcobacter nitrofigilis DSM 7299]
MKYHLSNNFIEVSIKNLGAELCSLRKKDNSLEYIWQGDKKYWNRHSPILFPFVGKLLDNEYIYDNKTYQMGQHGFARDKVFEVFTKEDDYICFKLKSTKETLEIYPFEFELYLSYKLIKTSLEISYKVINKSKNIMYFSIGAHPAFNWPLEKEDKANYYLEFENTKKLERLPLTINGISNKKELINLENNKLALSEELFKDDALVLQNLTNKTITLKNSKDDKSIEMSFEGFPYLGIWSKPSGAPLICIEPWHGIADFIGHNKKLEDKTGIISLDKNEVFESSYTISI